MTLRRPGYDVPSRNQILEQIEGRFHDRRLIEEFDHQGEILGKALIFVVRSRLEWPNPIGLRKTVAPARRSRLQDELRGP